SGAITALVVSVVHGQDLEHDLSSIARAVVNEGIEDHLDALTLVPLLIPSAREGSDQLLETIGQHCSAKEIVIAVQESTERVGGIVDEDQADEGHVSLAMQVARIMALYASGELPTLSVLNTPLHASAAIPRLKVRIPPSEKLQTIFPELEETLSSAAAQASVHEGRTLVSNASHLVQKTAAWASENGGADSHELPKCNVLLTSFLDTTLEACAGKIASSVDQRTFEACFPRFVYRSAVRPDWEEGAKAVLSALEASDALGRTFDVLHSQPTIASLVLLAHSSPPNRPTLAGLISIFPLIMTSLQSNAALDSSLAILLQVLCGPSAGSPKAEVSADILIPLATVFPALCSAHPEPATRHLTFRLFGQLLRLTPPPLRLQILADLLSPAEDAFPQMRTAAVGLVKDAVLEALAVSPDATKTSALASVFGSPLLLQSIGRFVFRSDPADLFSSQPSMDEFQDSPEPARLAECLGFYYVLLLRDTDNRTGIRDPSSIRSIEASFLGPLRLMLRGWLEDDAVSRMYDLHDILPLASLQTSVERIDAALEGISA
ncbi:hypothetical protein FA95DRAFT_1499530, partial [Auriscalpium vulgare]